MSTTDASRPSLTPKHSQSSEKKRNDALDAGIRMTLDGQAYEARMGDMTASLARELRAGTGMSFMTLMSTLGDDPDLDVVAAFIWLSRRIRGEQVELNDVIVDYASILSGLEVEVAKPEEIDHTNPEA